MRTPAEAATAVLASAERLPPETVDLLDALDRVLAEEVISPVDIPAWTNSAMDGYALNSRLVDADSGLPLRLRVADEISAGEFPRGSPSSGECTRIFTGAPLPENTDTVIRQEDVTREGDWIAVNDLRDLGRNTRERGEDIRKGSTVLQPGAELGPAQIGVLASVLADRVRVYRRPRVAVLGTGDEIAELSEKDAVLAGRKIASSNTYTMISMTRHAGGIPVNIGIARDDPRDLTEKLARAAECDLIVTSAGISVGEHDHVRDVLEDMGSELRFWRIRMRPGAPVGHGILREKPWIGLPGNPVSTMVTFELFVRPAIRKMLGYTTPFRRTTKVVLGEDVSIKTPLTHFLRVSLHETEESLRAYLTGPQGSGILTSMAHADALLIVPETEMENPAGKEMRAIVLSDPGGVAEPEFP